MHTVRAPKALQDIFSAAELVVSRYFQARKDDPEHGTIEISGERYVLVRAASLSVEFFALVRELYGSGREPEADEFSRNILFDLAHAIGKKDAKSFHAKMGLTDPLARMSAGPVLYAHAGWAFVDIITVAKPSPLDGYLMKFEHPYSFESDAWIRSGEKRDFPVCVMGAGYSSGWCEESFGVELVAAEVRCRAKGDDACRFVMSHPTHIEEHVRAESPSSTSIIPNFFARKQVEEELRFARAELERRVEQRTVDLKREMDERRRVEEQLHRQNKLEALGRLAGGVAHDFNNLMAVVLTNGTLLERALPKDDPRRGYTDEMMNAVYRAAELTRQLLAFGKSPIGERESIDVDSVLGHLTRMLGRLIGDDVSLSITLAGEEARIFASRSELEQVVVNLVVNARDALPDGGKIGVATQVVRGATPDLDKVVLEVSDSGIGMSTDVQASMFDPFFTTKGSAGTGLGLSTVYGIVQRSGGTITVESREGSGSTFVITLPRSEVEPRPPPVHEPVRVPPRGNGETVLLVEDQPRLRDALRAGLVELGYVPALAADAASALAAIRDGLSPNVLLTDVMLPHRSGIELADVATMERPGLEVVFMSANPVEGLSERRERGSVVGYLAKPFSIDALGLAIGDALARRNAKR